MLESKIISKQWLVRISLSQRFNGNHTRQSGVSLVEGHTPRKQAEENLSNILNPSFHWGIWLVGLQLE